MDDALGVRVVQRQRGLADERARIARGVAVEGGTLGLWEVYWTDPGIESDPRKWRTQLVRPLRAK